MTVRVLSYPPVHDYVDRLRGPGVELVHRDQPWPELPNLYDPVWLAAHEEQWDIAHFHFTWEQYPVEQFGAVLDVHARNGTPVVWTAHDLRNPHTGSAGRDEAYLRLLAEVADHVVTLTPGAAHELHRRFGRRAEVIAHGPVLPVDVACRWRGRAPASRQTVRLIVHLRSVRANVDWRTPLCAVSELAEDGVPVQLTVQVERSAEGLDLVVRHAGRGVRVVPHEDLALEDLCARLVEADAVLLPYRWGTHSGMLELLTDLGVTAIVGDVGYLAEQAPCSTVAVRDGRLDADGLRRRIQDLVSGCSPVQVSLDRRRVELRAFQRRHAQVYRRLAA